MKLHHSLLLFSAFFAGSFMVISAQTEKDDTTTAEATDQSAQLTEYKNSLQQEYKNLRKLIIKAAPKDVMSLNNAFRAIQAVEKDPKYGITDLQKQIAQLRVEACKKQLEDKEIKALVDQSIAKVQEIDKITKPEQQKSNDLSKQMNTLLQAKKSKDDPVVKKVENELKEIQKQMREKTKTQIELIQANNEKIYKKLPDLMKKGGELMKQLKAKYTAAKNDKEAKSRKQDIGTYDAKVASTTKLIEKALHKHEAELKRVRTSIKDLRTKIYEIEPCYSAQESLDDMAKKDYNWEQLFIS